MLKTSTGSFGRSRLTSRKVSSPLRPGIVMSRTITSQFSFETRFNASVALRASPNCARLKWSARISFKPCRTTAWSSVTRSFMRVQFVLPVLFSRSRNPHAHGRALAGFAAKTHLAAEQRGAFAHPEQADGFCVLDLIFGNAAPVVLHFQNEIVAGSREPHLDAGGVGVADDVGERLLKNAEERRVQILVGNGFADGRFDAAPDSRLPLKFIRLPLDRREQTGAVDQSRAQLRFDPPAGLDDFVHPVGHHLRLF